MQGEDGQERWGMGGRSEEKRRREAPSPIVLNAEPRGPSEELARTIHTSILLGPAGGVVPAAELPLPPLPWRQANRK